MLQCIFFNLKFTLDQMAPVLNNNLLAMSLENTNSYCLQGIENHNNQNSAEDDDVVEVSSLSGLESVVTVLEEVLMWPSKVRHNFLNFFLKLAKILSY